MPDLNDEQQLKIFRAFTKWLAVAITLLVALPTLFAYVMRPPGSLYLGVQYNFDDHMVYAAWMRQAMEGHLTFENRFTAEPQLGLTVQLYFLILGWIAKVVGIPVAANLGRLAFTYVSVLALGRLVEFVTEKIYSRKLALTMATIGGGIGFLVWNDFGRTIERPTNDLLKGLLLSRLPVDVWQPEGFFLYGAITNGLFMVSLFLILVTLVSVLKAKSERKSIVIGAICFGLLMNIHSYDVLLVTLLLVGFVAATVGAKQFETQWFLRAVLIGLGAVPAAAWFVYVLKNDPVFQARAATLTYSPNFRQIFAGYVLLMAPALAGLIDRSRNRLIGLGIYGAMIIGMLLMSSDHLTDSYFMSLPVWIGLFAVSLVTLYLLKPDRPGLGLVAAWALVGLIAPYFPALFQRKLTMMLSVPWGILAGVGVASLLDKRERGQRNLLTTLGLVVVSATGIHWFTREMTLAKKNVSNTTLHTIYYASDVQKILSILQGLGRNAVIGALPGVSSPSLDEATHEPIVDSFETPLVADLNPVLVGIAGVRSYAGHWSETPDYEKRRNALGAMLLSDHPDFRSLGITHLVIPKDGVKKDVPIRSYGKVLFSGTEWALVQVP